MALKFESSAVVGNAKIFDASVAGHLDRDDSALNRVLASAARILAGEVMVLSPEEALLDRIRSGQRSGKLLARAKHPAEQQSVE